MKRKDLLERLSPKLSDFTVLNIDIESPFGWDLSADTKPEKFVPPTPVRPYNVKSDKHVAHLFKPLTVRPEKLRSILEANSLIIVAGLCNYVMSQPHEEDVAALMAILGVSAAEMNDFTNDMPDEFFSCLGTNAQKPLSLLLHRALWDTLCEDSGIIGWSWVEYQKSKKNAAETSASSNSSNGEALSKPPKSPPKSGKPGKSSSKKRKISKGERIARKRLLAVFDYIDEHDLLKLDCLRGQEDALSPSESRQQRMKEAEANFSDFFYKFALLVCKRTIAMEEASAEHTHAEREKEHVVNAGTTLMRKTLQENLREILRTKNANPKPAMQKLPLSDPAAFLPEASNALSFGRMSDRARSGKKHPFDIEEAMERIMVDGSFEEMLHLMKMDGSDRYLSPVLLHTKNRIMENCEALDRYYKAVIESSVKAINQIHALEAEYLKRESGAEVTEWALISILLGDEVCTLPIGRHVFAFLGQLVAIPWFVTSMPSLEDDEEWDSTLDNGNLAREFIHGNEVAFYDREISDYGDMVHAPLMLNAAITAYAGCRFDNVLSLRKSVIKAFRSMGYSERKAREYAIIVATLRTVQDGDLFSTKHFFHESQEGAVPQTVQVFDTPDPRLQATATQRDEALRAKKIAENESQRLRHELADMQRKQAELERKLEQQQQDIQKRDELITLYEQTNFAESDPDELPEEKDLFPFHTNLRVVLYGGFHSFHQDVERLIPGIRIVPYASHIDLAPFRKADIIFLQINRTSHSNYWNICDTARNMEIPYYHLNFAGPKRCAVEMVKKIREIEQKKTP